MKTMCIDIHAHISTIFCHIPCTGSHFIISLSFFQKSSTWQRALSWRVDLNVKSNITSAPNPSKSDVSQWHQASQRKKRKEKKARISEMSLGLYLINSAWTYETTTNQASCRRDKHPARPRLTRSLGTPPPRWPPSNVGHRAATRQR